MKIIAFLTILISFSVMGDELADLMLRNGPLPPDINQKIYELDSLGNSNLREIPEGAIKLKSGPIIDKTCLERRSHIGVSEKDFTEKLNTAFSATANNIIRCQDEYPELKPYLSEWITSFRRHILKCEPNKEGSNVNGHNDLNGTTTLTYSVFEKLFTHGRKNFEAMSTVSHEILHSTTCNNRSEHNELGEDKSKVKTCGENISIDRVYVVTSLCFRKNLNNLEKPAAEVLANKMDKCGTDRGCINLFTDKGNSISFLEKYLDGRPTNDLDVDTAVRLCQRIKDDGLCMYSKRVRGDYITSKQKTVQALLSTIKDKVSLFMPENENEFPNAFIENNAEVKKSFSNIKETNCFKQNTRPTDKGFLFFPFRDKFWEDYTKKFSRYSYQLPDHIKNFEYKILESSIRNCSKNDKDKIKNFIKTLHAELVKNDPLSEIYENLKWIKSRHEIPFDYPDGNYEKLAGFLGPEIHKKLVEVMKKYHHDSPFFDCVAAGLSPFRETEIALKPYDLLCD